MVVRKCQENLLALKNKIKKSKGGGSISADNSLYSCITGSNGGCNSNKSTKFCRNSEVKKDGASMFQSIVIFGFYCLVILWSTQGRSHVQDIDVHSLLLTQPKSTKLLSTFKESCPSSIKHKKILI